MDGEHCACTSAPGILLVCPHAWDPWVAPRAQVPAVSMSSCWGPPYGAVVLSYWLVQGDFLQEQGVGYRDIVDPPGPRMDRLFLSFRRSGDATRASKHIEPAGQPFGPLREMDGQEVH